MGAMSVSLKAKVMSVNSSPTGRKQTFISTFNIVETGDTVVRRSIKAH